MDIIPFTTSLNTTVTGKNFRGIKKQCSKVDFLPNFMHKKKKMESNFRFTLSRVIGEKMLDSKKYAKRACV